MALAALQQDQRYAVFQVFRLRLIKLLKVFCLFVICCGVTSRRQCGDMRAYSFRGCAGYGGYLIAGSIVERFYHCSRHLCATWAICSAAAIDNSFLRSSVCHSNVAVTARIFGHQRFIVTASLFCSALVFIDY